MKLTEARQFQDSYHSERKVASYSSRIEAFHTQSLTRRLERQPCNRTGERPMYTGLLPMTMIIPTRKRAAAFRRTLERLAAQSPQRAELIIVDATDFAGTVVAAANEACMRRSALLWMNEPLLTGAACAQRRDDSR